MSKMDLGYAISLVRRNGGQILTIAQMEALKAQPDALEHAAGGYWEAANLVLLHGDLSGKTSLPYRLIPRPEGQPDPDPSSFELLEGGKTVRLGEFVAKVKVLLAGRVG